MHRRGALAVERTVKGAVQPPVVAIWNEGAGSSCGGLFRTLAVRTSVAIAVVRVADVDPRLQETWPLMDFHPSGDDLLVELGCGTPMKVFVSDRERDRWLRRQRH